MKMNKTPGLVNYNPLEPKKKMGIDLVYKIEDDYMEWRRSCYNGLCKYDVGIEKKFKSEINEARNEAGLVVESLKKEC